MPSDPAPAPYNPNLGIMSLLVATHTLASSSRSILTMMDRFSVVASDLG
jgi:hypothetical protein